MAKLNPDALKPLYEELVALVRKLSEMEKPINDAIAFKTIHGFPYDGPNWEDSVNAALATIALAESPAEQCYCVQSDSTGTSGAMTTERAREIVTLMDLPFDCVECWPEELVIMELVKADRAARLGTLEWVKDQLSARPGLGARSIIENRLGELKHAG